MQEQAWCCGTEVAQPVPSRFSTIRGPPGVLGSGSRCWMWQRVLNRDERGNWRSSSLADDVLPCIGRAIGIVGCEHPAAGSARRFPPAPMSKSTIALRRRSSIDLVPAAVLSDLMKVQRFRPPQTGYAPPALCLARDFRRSDWPEHGLTGNLDHEPPLCSGHGMWRGSGWPPSKGIQVIRCCKVLPPMPLPSDQGRGRTRKAEYCLLGADGT